MMIKFLIMLLISASAFAAPNYTFVTDQQQATRMCEEAGGDLQSDNQEITEDGSVCFYYSCFKEIETQGSRVLSVVSDYKYCAKMSDLNNEDPQRLRNLFKKRLHITPNFSIRDGQECYSQCESSINDVCRVCLAEKYSYTLPNRRGEGGALNCNPVTGQSDEILCNDNKVYELKSAGFFKQILGAFNNDSREAGKDTSEAAGADSPSSSETTQQ
jgi:hypothetical protein